MIRLIVSSPDTGAPSNTRRIALPHSHAMRDPWTQRMTFFKSQPRYPIANIIAVLQSFPPVQTSIASRYATTVFIHVQPSLSMCYIVVSNYSPAVSSAENHSTSRYRTRASRHVAAARINRGTQCIVSSQPSTKPSLCQRTCRKHMSPFTRPSRLMQVAQTSSASSSYPVHLQAYPALQTPHPLKWFVSLIDRRISLDV